jgi:hypothetical protein
MCLLCRLWLLMLSPDDYVAGYLIAAERLQNDTVNAAIAAWRSLGQYRDADVARFKKLVVPVIQAQQSKMARLTAAFHSEVGKQRGDDVPMVLLDRVQVMEPRGISSSELYQRPAVSLYTELSAGGGFASAVSKSENRLRQIVSTDMQLVKTKQSDRSLSAGGFTYYRRTLTGTEDCALCVIASTQRYRVGNLLPIHPGCNCGVDKVDSAWDPGQILDPTLLQDTHGKISRELGTSDSGARDLGVGKTVQYQDSLRNADFTELIVTRQNGEYGPALVWRSDRFTGPSAL